MNTFGRPGLGCVDPRVQWVVPRNPGHKVLLKLRGSIPARLQFEEPILTLNN